MQVEGHKNSPASCEGWVGFLSKSALALACLLLASCAICWVAANWEYASNFQKLAGAQLLLAVLVVVAWILGKTPDTGKNRNFSVFAHITGLAALMLGALLALIGQIYQTGADHWTLFIWWFALLLPWLLVVRTVFLGLLCTLLLNLGLASYLNMDGSAWFGLSSPWLETGLLLALANAFMLFAWERNISHLDDSWRLGPRTTACFAAGWLVIGALAGLDSAPGSAMVVVPGLMACALVYWVYANRLVDLAMVSLAGLTALCLMTIGLFPFMESEAALLFVIIVLLALTGLFLHRLGVLMRLRVPDAMAVDQAQASQEPWFIVLFRLAAMGVAVILMIAFLFMVLEPGLERWWLWGLLVCAGGMLIQRTAVQRYAAQLGLTLVATGLIMTGIGVYVLEAVSPFIRAWGLMALGVLLYRYSDNIALRFLIAFFVLALTSLLTWPESSRYDLLDISGNDRVWTYFPAYLRLWWLAVAAILAVAVGSRRRDPTFWWPLAWALVCLTQLIAWLAPAPAVHGLAAAWLQLPGLVVIWLACAALPVVALGALLWRVRGMPHGLRLGAPVALAVASTGWMGAPGVSMALLWLILGYALAQRTLLVFGMLALLAYLGRFYYQMDSTLLGKSLVLGLTGAWLLLSWYALGRLTRRQTLGAGQLPSAFLPVPVSTSAQAGISPAQPHGQTRNVSPAIRTLGLLAGLVAALTLANTEIYRNEQILTQGQRVVLALAPVDPRSLMQGDYMDLRFQVAGQVGQALQAAPQTVAQSIQAHRGGYLLLQPDRQGVHRLAAVLADLDAGRGDKPADAGRKDEVGSPAIMAFRWRNDVARIGTDAWFFPEGQASRYAQARFGEFRVDKHGVGLLLRLLDEQLKPLP